MASLKTKFPHAQDTSYYPSISTHLILEEVWGLLQSWLGISHSVITQKNAAQSHPEPISNLSDVAGLQDPWFLETLSALEPISAPQAGVDPMPWLTEFILKEVDQRCHDIHDALGDPNTNSVAVSIIMLSLRDELMFIWLVRSSRYRRLLTALMHGWNWRRILLVIVNSSKCRRLAIVSGLKIMMLDQRPLRNVNIGFVYGVKRNKILTLLTRRWRKEPLYAMNPRCSINIRCLDEMLDNMHIYMGTKVESASWCCLCHPKKKNSHRRRYKSLFGIRRKYQSKSKLQKPHAMR